MWPRTKWTLNILTQWPLVLERSPQINLSGPLIELWWFWIICWFLDSLVIQVRVSGILMTHSGGNNAAGKYLEANDGLRRRACYWGIKSLINFLQDCQHQAQQRCIPLQCQVSDVHWVNSLVMIVKHEKPVQGDSAQNKVLWSLYSADLSPLIFPLSIKFRHILAKNFLFVTSARRFLALCRSHLLTVRENWIFAPSGDN